MSFDRFRAIAALELDSAPAKAVLFALATFADADSGACWPSVATLVRATALNERSVQRAIKQLVTLGYITRTYRYGHSSILTVRDGALMSQGRPSVTPVPLSPPAESHPPPAESHPTPVTQSPRTDQGTAKEQGESTPVQESPVRKEPTSAIEDFLPTDWKPKPEMIEKLRVEFGFDFTPSVRSFVAHYSSVAGARARCRDWNARFELWAREDARKGRLAPPPRPHGTMSPRKTPLGTPPPIEESAAAARAALEALSELDPERKAGT